MNPNLKKGCPALIKFLNALKLVKLDPRIIKTEKILGEGGFGWHGTQNAENVAKIAYSNLDPNLRSGQCFGEGEYCAENPSDSLDFYSGNTETLFLFFFLKINPIYRFNTYHVINNPKNPNKNKI